MDNDFINFSETKERNPHLSFNECLKLYFDCYKIALIKEESELLKEFVEKLDGIEIEVL